ncbi:MAG: MmgE/PrpD family protein, partial [Planctomycetes bacterium]|nr:MmgE/PrpD family protein [Planctomycetota bacterium]
ADLDLGTVPAEVVDKARACLLHGIVVGLAGVKADFPAIAWKCTPETGSPGGARLLIDGRLTGRAQAAFANGVLLHARVQEDTHGTSHIGTVAIPAALAVAESVGADGKRLLEGLVAGYEVAGALGREYTARTTPRAFRASAIYGPFAAAAAAARILGLDARATANALAFASAFAGGTTESFVAGSMEWHFENGVAAQNGVLAAEIAANGGEGAERALEGRVGFLQAVAGTTEGAERVAAGLGKVWELPNVTFKLCPTCAFNQSPVATMVRLARAHNLQPEDVKRIDIEMNEYEVNYPGMVYQGPFRSVGQTQMSTPFCLSLALVDRGVSLDGLLRFDDPRLLDLVRRVEMHADAGRLPMTVRLRVTTRDGRILEQAQDQRAEEFFVWGFDRVREMARELAPETPFSLAKIEAIADLIAGLDARQPVSTLIDRLIKDHSRRLA